MRVYVRSEKIVHEIPGEPAAKEHPCYGSKHEVIVRLPEDHERAKKIAEDVAEEKGLDVEIHDLSNSFKGSIAAFFRGIKTPTIEIGNRHFYGVPSKEKLLSLLDEERE